jgi:ABC-type Fe3+ transport system substrate-binding protein
MTFRIIGALLASLLASSAVSAMTVDQVANYNKPDRQKVLEEGAKKEGELLWIGALDERKASRPLLEAFIKKYPYIKANVIRMNTAQAVQRVMAEHRARTPRVDIFNGSELLDLKQIKLAQKVYSPALSQYPDEFKDPNGQSAAIRYTYQGVAAWNTNLVKKEEAPKTFEDLLDPKWKGKMVQSDSNESGTPFLITFLRQVWGEKKALDYLEKLSKQDIVTRTESAQNITDLVVAGEYSVMINPALHHIAGRRALKAPIDGAMQDPVLARNDNIILMANAPHPHAGMLLFDFLIDKEAQTILKDAEYYPAHPGVDPAEEMKPYLPRAFNLKQYNLEEEVQMKNSKESAEIFRRLFK